MFGGGLFFKHIKNYSDMENTEEKKEKAPIVKITIDEDYFITADTHCWALNLERFGEMNNATGKPKVSRNQTYQPTLKAILLDYMDNAIKPSTTAAEILQRLEQVEATIAKIDFSPFARTREKEREPEE